jgi:nucleoid DNA-binding protein
MPLKEFLVKKLSLQSNRSERIIDTVISHQFSSAFQATATHNTIELSGFGKLSFNMSRGQKQMKKYENVRLSYEAELADPNITPERVRNLTMKLATIQKNVELLKPKLNHEPKPNIRRVAKQIDTTRGSESSN